MKPTQVVLIVIVLCLCLYFGMSSRESYSLDNYKKFEDYDLIGEPREGVECFEKTNPEKCMSICDSEIGCIGFRHSEKNDMCCLSGELLPVNKHVPGEQITSYVKIPDGYTIEQKGERLGGDIKILEEVGLDGCAKECDSLDECVGFTFHGTYCIPKKSEGLMPKYMETTSKQFFSKT
jgi:hypothetical protein